MPIFSKDSLKQTLGRASLGSSAKNSLLSKTGTKNTAEARGQLLKTLAGKTNRDREKVYSKFGLEQAVRKKIESVIDKGEKQYTKSEAREIKRAEEVKKKVNIFLSRRSAEEGGSGYEAGVGHYAGGSVESRSRVGAIGIKRKESDDLGIYRQKTGFAKNLERGEKGFSREAKTLDRKNEGERGEVRNPAGINFGGGV